MNDSEEKIAISVGNLKARIAKLRKEADQLNEEANRLTGLLELAKEIGEPVMPSALAPYASTNPGSGFFVRPPELTGEMVEEILRSNGRPMHVQEIITALHESGWRGSGDDRKDYKNVFANLTSKPKRFNPLGMSKFELLDTETEGGPFAGLSLRLAIAKLLGLYGGDFEGIRIPDALIAYGFGWPKDKLGEAVKKTLVAMKDREEVHRSKEDSWSLTNTVGRKALDDALSRNRENF